MDPIASSARGATTSMPILESAWPYNPTRAMDAESYGTSHCRCRGEGHE